MTGFPASFSPLQLHNRLNRLVQIGFRRVRRDGRELVFLTAGSEAGILVRKNFETFAGQIVREFRIDPAETDFIELRLEAGNPSWYRWHAHWVGSAPMECSAEPVVGESGRRYLMEALETSEEAA
ncbi:hypothetical protein AUP74_00079 [Microbulbifer aggregans]|uniref:Uncharacterized protein n=1 Tax=Microbulbifer aggregans TaxID=1769779 RepID=A0A1C9W324_9GAMM|nr:hypothetical protein [Microbulbifer aggregans]AOS95556.1 hypothetical protein AUP74_00079 [Microbulbifer aggregans]